VDLKEFTEKCNKTVLISFAAVGALVLASSAKDYATGFYTHFLRPRRDLAKRYGEGSWALITGAAEGIGRSFALQLASSGFNIILLDDNKERLNAVSAEIEAQFHVKTMTLYCDLTQSNHSLSDFEDLLKDTNDLDISFLINNSGKRVQGDFLKTPFDKMESLININTSSAVYLSRILIPKMITRRNRSAIINMSSSVVHYTPATLSVYSATKAFLEAFSNSLAAEYEERIDVLSALPGKIITNSKEKTRRMEFAVTADECARSILDNLGYTYTTVGHYKHALRNFYFDSLFDRMRINRHFEVISE